MRQILLSVAAFLLPLLFLAQQQASLKIAAPSERPKIGLTLSGGGARGLAHIGILKALDSAGLHVDFVTGTSMGSVIGGLYATGYSGKEIEQIAKHIDWDILFTNRASLQSFIMEEKSEYQKYAVELPRKDKKFQLSGVLESQELWLKFSELFFPVYATKDFSKFPRGFQCIGANISTGEPVALKQGEIVSAVRASMSIPSIFRPVEWDSLKLVDGGIVRNFPVKNVMEMGAEFVIGSNVSGDLLTTEKINDLFEVITQVTSFQEDKDLKEETKLCNVYIFHRLKGFGTSDFASADDIIKAGTEEGEKFYPIFKRIKDSLDVVYGPQPEQSPVVRPESVVISDYEVRGLKATTAKFFFQRNEIIKNRAYTPGELAEGIRKAFGANYYSRITYSLQPLPDGTAKIIYDVQENPMTFVKLILNYNSFQGVGLVANITARNLLNQYSRSMLAVNIGDNMKFRAEHLQLFGKEKNRSVTTTVYGDILNNFPLYTNFTKQAIYQLGNLKGDILLGSASKRKLFFGIGSSFEALYYKPDHASVLQIKGNTTFFNTYVVGKFNTLTNSIYPERGTKIEASAGYLYNQQPDFRVFNHGQAVTNLDSMGLGKENYAHLNLNIEHYIPLVKRLNVLTQTQMGIDFSKKENLSNAYFIGGVTRTFRNQIVFIGLREATVNTNSIFAARASLRYKIFANAYLLAHFNMGAYDFAGNKEWKDAKFISGYGLTLAVHYLGPLQISVMYSDQFKKVLSYVNLGIPF
jgi:NTE family protein